MDETKNIAFILAISIWAMTSPQTQRQYIQYSNLVLISIYHVRIHLKFYELSTQKMRQPYSLNQESASNLTGYSTAGRIPADKKKVAFSQNDEVRTYEVDLRYNDEDFILIARQLMTTIRTELRKKKEPTSWLPSFFKKSDRSIFDFDEKKLDNFKHAFEYRMEQLPEIRKQRSNRVNNVMREFVREINNAGWPDMVDDKENIATIHNSFPEHSNQKSIGVDDSFYTEFKLKRCEVEMLSEEVRNRVANNLSVETLLSEVENLHELASSTKSKKIKEYCGKEVQTMENMLEDMGYTRSQNYW